MACEAALILLSVILLSLSFAPFGQFYLAWMLTPWLIAIAGRSFSRRARLAGVALRGSSS